jgi:pimeloyl-ACP methyl ester carboxylesterase
VIEALALGPVHVAGISWSGAVVQELYRHHRELVATLILVDTYAIWKGSLPEEEVRARVDATYQALMVPAETVDPARALPGWFAGDPPVEFVPLLEDMGARDPGHEARRDRRRRPRQQPRASPSGSTRPCASSVAPTPPR